MAPLFSSRRRSAAQQPPRRRPRAAANASDGLTVAQIEKPSTDSWPTYNGDYSGRRFSSLTKINAANVKNLSLAWIYDLPAPGTIKATPLQIGGVLYFTTPNHVYAVDARTARELWHYTFAGAAAASRSAIAAWRCSAAPSTSSPPTATWSRSTSRPARRNGRRSSVRSR